MQESTITPIPIDRIAPSPRNPRQSLGHLDELTDSIRAYGLLQPIVVREHDDGRFEVVAGHRRFAAVQALGWSTVQVVREGGEYAHVIVEPSHRAHYRISGLDELAGIVGVPRRPTGITC